jgi:hypothetical protein
MIPGETPGRDEAEREDKVWQLTNELMDEGYIRFTDLGPGERRVTFFVKRMIPDKDRRGEFKEDWNVQTINLSDSDIVNPDIGAKLPRVQFDWLYELFVSAAASGVFLHPKGSDKPIEIKALEGNALPLRNGDLVIIRDTIKAKVLMDDPDKPTLAVIGFQKIERGGDRDQPEDPREPSGLKLELAGNLV